MEAKILESGDAKPQTPNGRPTITTAVPPAALLQSLSGLFDLNGLLSEFVGQWHALHRDLDSILSSIDRRSRELSPTGERDKASVGAANSSAVPPPPKAVDRAAELLSISESSSGRALRKFVVSNLSDLAWLRREVPDALLRSPNPARLVLDALGRFYLQGRKAYERSSDDPMVVFRRACILILEFYIVAGCTSAELDASVKKDAQVAALSWRSRLINEGGLQVATAVDALGLVLFLGSFGIPREFGCRDIYNLLLLSNLKKKADIFRKSSILCPKICDIIDDLIRKEMQVEAVDLICAFELKEKYPPLPLLISFLQKCTQSAKDEQREGQSSLKSLREANDKQLERLKLVVKCMDDYKLDKSALASFNITQIIAKLELEIANDDERLKNKRKAQEVKQGEVPNYWHSSAKRLHGVAPHLGKQVPEQKSAALPYSEAYYGTYLRRNVPDDGLSIHSGAGFSSATGGIHPPAGPGGAPASSAAEGSSRLIVGNSSHQYVNYSGGLYGLHGNGTHDGRLVGQNSSTVSQNAFYPQSSGTGYGGAGSSGTGYHFTDAALQREAYYLNSGISNPPPGVPNIPIHHHVEREAYYNPIGNPTAGGPVDPNRSYFSSYTT